MKTKIVKTKTSKMRKWLRRILIILAVIILVPIGLFTIGWLNRDTIIDKLQDLYSQNHSGNLTIGKVNANFLSGFPNVGFTLKDISQTNTDTITDIFSSVKIKEAQLTISAGNLLSGTIKFEKIVIKDAIIASEVISKRSLAYYENLKNREQPNQKDGFQLPEWINADGTQFYLEKVKYIEKDSILKKYFNLDIHQIKGSFKKSKQNLTGNAYFDITVNNLGFNTENGSFSNGARINGKPKFTVNLKNNLIDIEEFPLQIDQQTFQLKANFNLSDANTYAFQLQNPQTNFIATKILLSDNLADKVKNYQILKPFKSNLKITGTFAYGNNPDVTVKFSTNHNEIVIADKMDFKNAVFNGYLTTDIYATDSLGLAKKSGKDVKIFFHSFVADLEDIKVNLRNAYYQSTLEATNFVEADIDLEGSNEALARVVETDNFDFKGGDFQLKISISGDIPNPYQFLNKATGTFNLNNTQISLRKNGLQLPIQSIDLTLDREQSTLNNLIVNLPNGENLVFMGELKNISEIISKEHIIPTTSQISLNSKNLNLNDLISMAKSFIPKSEANVDNRKTLHETLEAINAQFHPKFSIKLDSLQYKEVTITNLKSNIDLVNAETILLHNFDFNYHDAITNLKGRVIVHEPNSRLKNAIYIDAEATSKGPISVFENLFDIKLFRIDDGNFEFQGNLNGDVKEFSELLNNASGNLNLTNTKLYYEPAEMEVSMDSLSLFVNRGDILFDKFNLEVGELYPIKLNGMVHNFPSFLLDNETDSGSVSLKITAPYLDGDELLTTINSLKNEKTSKFPKNKKAMHSIFKDLNKYNPKIELSVDSLKYKDLITENINAQLYFENDSILKLNNLDLRYKGTTANIHGKLNTHTTQNELKNDNPFDINFTVSVKGKSEDLNDYLKTKNFIFKSGVFEFNGNYIAQSEDLIELNAKTFGDLKISQTIVDYKEGGLQIPVDSLHIEINDDLATLKTLDINLPGKSSIEFAGTIENFSDFIMNSQSEKRHSSDFTIHSPYLDTSDIEEFLENTKSNKDQTVDKDMNLQKFKDAMLKINTSFYPTVTFEIDTLLHKDFNLTDFGIHFLFDANGNFKIEDTKLNFYGGSITMKAVIDISKDQNLPVNIDMQAKNINLHELVTKLDYFNSEDLRQAEKIEGVLNYNLKATGSLDNDGKINANSINGTLQLELENLELYNFKPIMDNSVLMKDERFKNLQFRPINQTFEIKNGELIIPRTEIQSSAIHMFIEGKLKFNDYVNVWVALPWKNLKSNDGQDLPTKTGYENAGSKFYIQLIQDKKNDKEKKLKVKFRLGNRKMRNDN